MTLTEGALKITFNNAINGRGLVSLSSMISNSTG